MERSVFGLSERGAITFLYGMSISGYYINKTWQAHKASQPGDSFLYKNLLPL